MYPQPHNKIAGRKYINNPSEGIPLALEILNNAESHRDDIMSAACYLAYRTLDGIFLEKEYAWKKLLEAKELSKIESNDPAWFKTRWIVSLTLISTYFEIIVFNNFPSRKELMEVISKTHVSNHPPQIVNILRASLLLASNEFFKARKLGMVEAHAAIDKYCDLAIELYRLAVSEYKIHEFREHVFIYEIWDAVEVLSTMMELKFSANSETAYSIDLVIEKWKNEATTNSNRQIYRKSLIKIYERNL